jgi:transposase
MFIRNRKVRYGDNVHEYLQIVENRREDGKVRQRVIVTLGRRDHLVASGALDGLLRSLGKFSDNLRVVERVRSEGLAARSSRSWGPSLVFERLWREQGLPEILSGLSVGRKFGFDPERVSFALALQRLMEPGSDLQGSDWLKTIHGDGFSDIQLHQMYRTVGWLWDVRQDLERLLFFRDRDLFTQELDLVFIDTTSTYIYRDEETEYAKRGYSRDHRPHLPQMVLCVAVDRRGWPIAWEVFPGNTADQAAFVEVIRVLRERFQIGRVSVVADRGMISKDSIKLLTEDEKAPFDYILGCRMRRQKEVSEEVLSRGGRYREVAPNLKVKEVWVDDRRYIVCRNDEEAAKDEAARETMVARLREKLESGQMKSLVGNTGYRRYLKGKKGAWMIDDEAVQADSRFDGMFVLRTNMELPADEIATTYKGLWRVERTFREEKSTLEMRPLFHHQDETRIGHIVASFLALRLEIDLQRRLEEKKNVVPWPNLMRDLERVHAVEVELDGQRYLLRTDLVGSAHSAFAAAGVRPPSSVTPLGHVMQ